MVIGHTQVVYQSRTLFSVPLSIVSLISPPSSKQFMRSVLHLDVVFPIYSQDQIFQGGKLNAWRRFSFILGLPINLSIYLMRHNKKGDPLQLRCKKKLEGTRKCFCAKQKKYIISFPLLDMLPSLYTIYIFIIIFFARKTTNGTIVQQIWS